MLINFVLFLWYYTFLVLAKDPSQDELRSVLKKVQEEIELTKKSNADLNAEISQTQRESLNNLTDFNLKKYNLSSELEKEIDKLKMLQSNLTTLHQEEIHVMREERLVNSTREKLDLGLQLVEEDLAKLESRRKTGVEEKCAQLIPSLTERNIKIRKVNLNEEDEIILLENELALEKTKLFEVLNKNEELKEVLKSKASLSNIALNNLQSMIKEIDGDLSRAKQRVDLLSEKCENKKAQVNSAKANLHDSVDFMKGQKESLVNLRNKLIQFGNAIQCYNRLEEEIFRKHY